MRKKIIMSLLLITVIFLGFRFYSRFDFRGAYYEKLATAITIKTANKVQNEKGLFLIGTGGKMMGDIKMMMMGFECYKVISLEEARNLLIYSVNEYLTEINTNEKIRPYLHNYPFTAKNIEIVIYCSNPDGSEVSTDQLSIASLNEGRILYYMRDPDDNLLKIIYKEPYDEALKNLPLVKLDNSSCESQTI